MLRPDEQVGRGLFWFWHGSLLHVQSVIPGFFRERAACVSPLHSSGTLLRYFVPYVSRIILTLLPLIIIGRLHRCPSRNVPRLMQDLPSHPD